MGSIVKMFHGCMPTHFRMSMTTPLTTLIAARMAATTANPANPGASED